MKKVDRYSSSKANGTAEKHRLEPGARTWDVPYGTGPVPMLYRLSHELAKLNSHK